MYSLYLPSSQLQDLTAQFHQAQCAREELPDVSDLADTLDGCIEVDIDEPNANVVYVGLDRSGRKAVDEIARQVDTAGDAISGLQTSIIEQIGTIFKHYVRVLSRAEIEPSPDDRPEQFEAIIDQDLRSLSIYEWKDALGVIPPSVILSEVLTHWTPELSKRLGWWWQIENTMKSANAVSRSVVDSFRRGNDIDPAWREVVLENIRRGFESEKLLSQMAGTCAVVHAIKVPTASFMGWTNKQWYKHITSLDLTPEYSSGSIASLIRPPDKASEASPEAIQKKIMARFRRLFFLDPEVAKKTFGLFAPGDRDKKIVSISTDNTTKGLKDILLLTSSAFHSNCRPKISMGQTLSNVFLGLDQALEKAGISTSQGYADLFHELRTELQIGAEGSLRLEKDCAVAVPKM